MSPLTRQIQAQAHADSEDGAALRTATRRKRTTYPELCGLVTLARARGEDRGPLELGGSQLPAHPCAAPEPPHASCRVPKHGQWMGTALVGPFGHGRAAGCGHDRAWPSLAHDFDWGRRGPAT